MTEGQAGAVRGTAPPLDQAVDGAPGAALDTEEPRSPLVGMTWRWERFVDPIAGGLDIPEPSRYTVLFTADGIVRVVADCNEGSGSYMVDENELTVRILRTTEEDCGDESLSEEFVDNVNSSSSFRLVDDRLVLSLRWDTGSMELAPSTDFER